MADTTLADVIARMATDPAFARRVRAGDPAALGGLSEAERGEAMSLAEDTGGGPEALGARISKSSIMPGSLGGHAAAHAPALPPGVHVDTGHLGPAGDVGTQFHAPTHFDVGTQVHAGQFTTMTDAAGHAQFIDPHTGQLLPTDPASGHQFFVDASGRHVELNPATGQPFAPIEPGAAPHSPVHPAGTPPPPPPLHAGTVTPAAHVPPPPPPPVHAGEASPVAHVTATPQLHTTTPVAPVVHSGLPGGVPLPPGGQEFHTDSLQVQHHTDPIPAAHYTTPTFEQVHDTVTINVHTDPSHLHPGGGHLMTGDNGSTYTAPPQETDTTVTATYHHPDGSYENDYSNGDHVIHQSDGTIYIEHPDGDTVVISTDGSWTDVHPDGSSVQHHTGGGVTYIDTDGSSTSHDVDGVTRSYDPAHHLTGEQYLDGTVISNGSGIGYGGAVHVHTAAGDASFTQLEHDDYGNPGSAHIAGSNAASDWPYHDGSTFPTGHVVVVNDHYDGSIYVFDSPDHCVRYSPMDSPGQGGAFSYDASHTHTLTQQMNSYWYEYKHPPQSDGGGSSGGWW